MIIEDHMKLHDLNYAYSKKIQTPNSNVNYRSELDLTDHCLDELGTLYSNAIDIIRWQKMTMINRISHNS